MSTEAARATLQAELNLQDGDVPGAVSSWREAVRADDTSPYLQVRLGEALLLVGDARGAASAATAALALCADGKSDDADADHAVAALRLQAQAFSDLGEAEQSESALRLALRRSPGDPGASAMLAERLVARGALDEAEKVVAAWSLGSAGVSGLVALARVFAERGQIDRAFRHLDAALAKLDDDEDALIARLNLLWALGRFDDAVVAARRLLTTRGDGPSTRSRLITALALSTPAEAIDTATALVAEDGSERTRALVAGALENGGLIDAAAGVLRAGGERPSTLAVLELARLELARRHPERALPIACGAASGLAGDGAEPGDGRLVDYATALCARAEADSGKPNEAIGRLLHRATMRPARARPLLALASVLEHTSASAAAEVAAQTARDVLEGTVAVDVTLAAASVLRVAGDHQGALAAGGRLLAARPADRTVVLGYARLLEADSTSQGETRGAVELVERQMERGGADVDTLNFVAFALADKDLRSADAVNFAWRAVLMEPTNGFITDTFGWAQLKNGQTEDAVRTLRRADRLSPLEGEIWFHIAAAEHACGRDTVARAAADTALSLLGPHDSLRARVTALKNELPSS